MKRILLTALLLLAVSTLPVLLSACEKSAPETDPGAAPDDVPRVVLPLEGDEAYVIVRPEDASKTEIAVSTELRKMLAEKTGINVTIKDDFVREGTKFQASEREICLGLTNREESRRAGAGLKVTDYRIRLDGTRLVIAYVSADAGMEAIGRFVEEFVSAGDKAVSVPEGLDLEVLRSYPFDTITIDGHDVSEYVIVGESSFTSAVHDEIARATGHSLRTSTVGFTRDRCIQLGTLDDLAPDEAGVRLVGGNVVAGTSGVEYDDISALPLLLSLLNGSAGTELGAKELDRKHTIVREYQLPFSRGINVNTLEDHPYTETDDMQEINWAYYLSTEDLFTQIRDRGFDHVRLPVNLSLYYDAAADALITSGTYDIGHIDAIITRALDAGLCVMLDFHGYWNFDAGDKEQRDLFLAVWERVAEHYKDWDERLSFELINEPAKSDSLNAVQVEALLRIRKTNPDRLVILTVGDGGTVWMLDTFVPPANDPNYALAVHFYHPGEFTHQGATWSDPTRTYQVRLTDRYRAEVNDHLNRIAQYMRKHPGVRIVLNEFGAYQKVIDEADFVEYISAIRGFCEEKCIPWAYWQYTEWPSLGTIRRSYEAQGRTWTAELEARFASRLTSGFGARTGYDGEWKELVMKALGMEDRAG